MDIPSFGGGLGRLLFGEAFTTGAFFRLIQGINRSVIRQLDFINCEINVFQN